MADHLTLKLPAGTEPPAGKVIYYCMNEDGSVVEYPLGADLTVPDVDPAHVEQLRIAGLVRATGPSASPASTSGPVEPTPVAAMVPSLEPASPSSSAPEPPSAGKGK